MNCSAKRPGHRDFRNLCDSSRAARSMVSPSEAVAKNLLEPSARFLGITEGPANCLEIKE